MWSNAGPEQGGSLPPISVFYRMSPTCTQMLLYGSLTSRGYGKNALLCWFPTVVFRHRVDRFYFSRTGVPSGAHAKGLWDQFFNTVCVMSLWGFPSSTRWKGAWWAHIHTFRVRRRTCYPFRNVVTEKEGCWWPHSIQSGRCENNCWDEIYILVWDGHTLHSAPRQRMTPNSFAELTGWWRNL